MAKYGLTGNSFRVNPYGWNGPKKEGMIEFPNLSGGLNLYDLDYRLSADESPDMKNLRWKDGALGCRPGQSWLKDEEYGKGFACYEYLFWDMAFFHAGDKIYYFDPRISDPEVTVLYTGLSETRGTFFRYRDYLFYKNRGGYVQISYRYSEALAEYVFIAESVAPYIPVTYISMNPTTHAGTGYQPENRLTRSKEIWYDAERDGEGNAVAVYMLPELAESVDSAIVDGSDAEYTVLKNEGTDDIYAIQFTVAPPVSEPFYPNTVRVKYTAKQTDNTDALYNAVMDCCYAAVFGGNQNVCVVMGGCPAQPNAYFWNGNHAVMDAGYFPVEQYNLAGDTEEAITAFGKQQNMLVIFKQKSVGRCTMSTTTTDSDRLLIEMPYTAINSRIGCDLPWTVQLVENNLVFCNTEQGVNMVLDSSSAYENNIVGISKKANGNSKRPGLLHDVQFSDVNEVCAFDDDSCYWIVANGKAYIWDYELSSYKDPSWFPYTNISAISFFKDSYGIVYHLNANGRLTVMDNSFSDYGEGIDKAYQFATQIMGTYDKLKDVTSALFVVRTDTNTVTQIRYDTDYEERYDLTPMSSFSWKFVPRDLSYRYLGFQKFSHTERREPKCRNIRHFSMRLENNVAGQDLSVISAQIFYNFQGRYR